MWYVCLPVKKYDSALNKQLPSPIIRQSFVGLTSGFDVVSLHLNISGIFIIEHKDC